MDDANPETAPWLEGVNGEQVIPLITEDHAALRVDAGPGTGKTFGLRKRVLRVLHPDGLNIAPNRVLVCAFNRVIAADLRTEIEKELTPHGLEVPVIATVHGLAGQMSGHDQRFLLPQETEAMMYDIRRSHPELNMQFGNIQTEAMRSLRKHEAGLINDAALATAVAQWLAAHGAALVGDLPRQVETRLCGGEFGDRRYDHVIVDEFQDLTDVEARLVLGLRADDAQVVALGDKKQSIYAFRGNKDRGLEALPELLAADVVDRPMDGCQRCPIRIVDLANDVMAIYNEPLAPLGDDEGQIHQVHHATPEAEQKRIAEEAVRVFHERPNEKHLILVTRRRWGYQLRDAIRKIDGDITAETVFSEDVLETWPARETFSFFAILANPEDAVSARDWLSYRTPDAEGKKWKAPARNADVYLNLREKRGVLNLEKLLEIADKPVNALRGSGRSYVLKRAQRLKQLRAEMPTDLTASGVVEWAFDPDRLIEGHTDRPELAREDVLRLRQEAERIIEETDGEPTDSEVSQQLRFRIATRQALGPDDSADIKIVTLWGAKGLTADYVYLVGLCDEALPGPYDSESTDQTPEEHKLEQQRLLYVSLTRAKQALVISRPDKTRRGQVPAERLLYRKDGNTHWQYLRQCRFFDHVSPDHLPDAVDGQDWGGIDLDS